MADRVLEELRRRVAEADRRLVETVNERLRLVARIKEHKREQGVDFVDPEQERRLLADRQRENGGPLSDEGVEQLVRAVLDLTKRELENGGVGSTEPPGSGGAGSAGAGGG